MPVGRASMRSHSPCSGLQRGFFSKAGSESHSQGVSPTEEMNDCPRTSLRKATFGSATPGPLHTLRLRILRPAAVNLKTSKTSTGLPELATKRCS